MSEFIVDDSGFRVEGNSALLVYEDENGEICLSIVQIKKKDRD